MSYLVLHADRAATALADDPIVPARDVAPLHEALALLAEAGRGHESVAGAASAAIEHGRSEGFAAGQAEARAIAEEEMRGELFRLAVRDGEERDKRRGEIAKLALEVVRHIAGDIGDAAMVAALADRATAALLPDAVATVRVAPSALAAAQARIGQRPGLTVEADASLAADDCLVETALGRTHASLATQLAQIERAWAEAAHGR